MTSPAVADALADPVIRKSPSCILVYWYCLGRLATTEMRWMRRPDVAKATGLSERRAKSAVATLCASGYLVRGERVLARWTYRLTTPAERAALLTARKTA